MEVHYATGEETFYRSAGIGKHATIGNETRSLYREYEVVRGFVVPFGKALRLLQSVVRAVDLDGCQFAAGEFQFSLLHETAGIETAAPRFVDPSANTDPDAWLCMARHDWGLSCGPA